MWSRIHYLLSTSKSAPKASWGGYGKIRPHMGFPTSIEYLYPKNSNEKANMDRGCKR